MNNANLNRFDVETANFPFITALFSYGWITKSSRLIRTARESEDNRQKYPSMMWTSLKIVYLWVML